MENVTEISSMISEYLAVMGVLFAIVVMIALLYKVFVAMNFARQKRKALVAILSVISLGVIQLTEVYWIPLFFDHETTRNIVTKGIAILWWISLSFGINQILDFFLWSGAFKKNDELIVPKILVDVSSAFVYMISGAGIVHYVFDKPITAIAATSGVLALILGYSAQNTLSDVFAGLGLNLAKVFDKGDWIEIDGKLGKVLEMNWRYLSLETVYENIMTVPNTSVAKGSIINFSRPIDHRGVILSVTVEGGAPPERVKALLVEAALDSFLVLPEPKPVVYLVEYKDNGLQYDIWYYTREPDDWEIRNHILTSAWYKLDREGISITLSDVNINYTPTHPIGAKYAPTGIRTLNSLTKGNPIFELLTEEERNQIFDCCEKPRRYGYPERIVCQGEPGDSLFVIASGEGVVSVATAENPRLEIARLGVGDVFGEMSLLTGEPRSTTVSVEEEAHVYEIKKYQLQAIFSKRKDVIEKIAALISARTTEREGVEGGDMEERAKRAQREAETIAERLSGRIREFFT